MFDFDEIETDVQQKGADAWKEGAGGGSAPTPTATAKTPTATAVPETPKEEDVNIRVGFCHKGQRWNQEFKVKHGSTILALKKLLTKGDDQEADWVQLLNGHLPASDQDVLEKDARLEFAFLPPRTPLGSKKLDMGEAPAGGWKGDLEVSVCYDPIGLSSTTFKVKKGSTVADLKQTMAKQDPTGGTSAEDFDLAVNGPGGRCPILDSTLIVDGRLSQLSLVPPVA